VGSGAPTDHFTDIGLDAQVETKAGTGSVVTRGTWIHEKQTLDATFAAGGSANPEDVVRVFRLNSSYYPKVWLGLTLGYFQTTGSAERAPVAVDFTALGVAAAVPTQAGPPHQATVDDDHLPDVADVSVRPAPRVHLRARRAHRQRRLHVRPPLRRRPLGPFTPRAHVRRHVGPTRRHARATRREERGW